MFNRRYSTGLRYPIINTRFLEIILKALTCTKTDLSRKSIANIKQLMESLDINYYSKDIDVYGLIQSINIALTHRTKMGSKIRKKSIITEIQITLPENYNDVKTNIIEPIIETSDDNTLDVEIEIMNKTIDLYLKYGSVINSKDKLSKILVSISSGNVMNMTESIRDLREVINYMSEEFRKSDNINTDIIHSTDEDFYDLMKDAYTDAISNKAVLKTGLKMFNDMISPAGGFYLGGYYMFYASINSFKSALLQYIAKWIRKYNSDAFMEEYTRTGKIPTVIYYSLENSKFENAKREFTMNTGKNIEDCSSVDAMLNMFKTKYEETNTIIDVVSVYEQASVVRVSDITKLIDELNDNGHKVVAVIIDYLELLRPEDEDINAENRIKLANISTRLLGLATSRNVAVITAQQINRDGESSLQDQKDRGSVNIVKALGRRYIGEAYGIDKPVIWSAYIAQERSVYDNKLYLTIKREKSRYRRTTTDYFVHELINNFYIQDDIYSDEILSKKAIMPEVTNEIEKNEEIIVGKRGVTNLTRKNNTNNKPKEKKEEDNTSPTTLIEELELKSSIALFNKIEYTDFIFPNLFCIDECNNIDGYIYPDGFWAT